jgi:hypothetical protein
MAQMRKKVAELEEKNDHYKNKIELYKKSEASRSENKDQHEEREKDHELILKVYKIK